MKSRPAPPCYTKDITWRWEKYVKWDLRSDPNSATLDKYSLLWFSVGFLFHLGTSDNFQYLHVKWSNKKIINSSSSISSIYTSSNFHPTAAQLYPRPSNSPAQGLLRALMLAAPVGRLIPTNLMASSPPFNSRPPFLSLRGDANLVLVTPHLTAVASSF